MRSTWVIGDIQGCFASLVTLLSAIRFDPDRDHLWLAGDLVNRGPRSLEVLRFAVEHESVVKAVLGNHDVHLLAVACGARRQRAGDTLDDVLAATDREALVEWLRCRPLLHHERGAAMIHAGLLPRWSWAESLVLAAEVEARLRADTWSDFLAFHFAEPRDWSPDLTGDARASAALRVLTTVRMIDDGGQLDARHSGPPEDAPIGLRPWFAADRADAPVLYFGHWAALGHRATDRWVSLDSGCVWGGRLTAWCLEAGHAVSVEARERG